MCMHALSYDRLYVHVCSDIFGDMSESVAPSISGDYTKDIKKAIACQVTATAVTVTTATDMFNSKLFAAVLCMLLVQ
jgi:hypothetical protein